MMMRSVVRRNFSVTNRTTAPVQVEIPTEMQQTVLKAIDDVFSKVDVDGVSDSLFFVLLRCRVKLPWRCHFTCFPLSISEWYNFSR